jgi:hypothetical protein
LITGHRQFFAGIITLHPFFQAMPQAAGREPEGERAVEAPGDATTIVQGRPPIISTNERGSLSLHTHRKPMHAYVCIRLYGCPKIHMYRCMCVYMHMYTYTCS